MADGQRSAQCRLVEVACDPPLTFSRWRLALIVGELLRVGRAPSPPRCRPDLGEPKFLQAVSAKGGQRGIRVSDTYRPAQKQQTTKNRERIGPASQCGECRSGQSAADRVVGEWSPRAPHGGRRVAGGLEVSAQCSAGRGVGIDAHETIQSRRVNHAFLGRGTRSAQGQDSRLTRVRAVMDRTGVHPRHDLDIAHSRPARRAPPGLRRVHRRPRPAALADLGGAGRDGRTHTQPYAHRHRRCRHRDGSPQRRSCISVIRSVSDGAGGQRHRHPASSLRRPR